MLSPSRVEVRSRVWYTEILSAVQALGRKFGVLPACVVGANDLVLTPRDKVIGGALVPIICIRDLGLCVFHRGACSGRPLCSKRRGSRLLFGARQASQPLLQTLRVEQDSCRTLKTLEGAVVLPPPIFR
jgi:hypothetical protein